MTTITGTWVVCLDNSGFEVSLEIRKTYLALPDPTAAAKGQLRIVDESGADYLYSELRFGATP